MVTTFGNKHLDLWKLKPDDVRIEDVAHHLACINRFNGALAHPINVAQHSVYVSWLVEGTGFEMDGLLHDKAEALVGDMTKWLKMSKHMKPFRDIEEHVDGVMALAFGVEIAMPEPVRVADALMVRFEAQTFDLTLGHPDYGPLDAETYDRVRRAMPTTVWHAWDWQTSEILFLRRYRDLLTRRQA